MKVGILNLIVTARRVKTGSNLGQKRPFSGCFSLVKNRRGHGSGCRFRHRIPGVERRLLVPSATFPLARNIPNPSSAFSPGAVVGVDSRTRELSDIKAAAAAPAGSAVFAIPSRLFNTTLFCTKKKVLEEVTVVDI